MGEYCDSGRVRRAGQRAHASGGERKQLQREAARAGPKGGGAAGGWGLLASDAEAKRRRRVAGYKAYAVEGKVKATVRQGFQWIKGKCSALVHRW